MITTTDSYTTVKNRERMLKIAKDTVDYFQKDPAMRRAVDKEDGSCMYTTDGGLHCAVGRYLQPKWKTTEWEQNSNNSINTLDRELDYYLISEVIGLEETFWQRLQDLHDERMNWDLYGDDGLTEQGNLRYGKLRIAIMEGGFDGSE